MEISQIIPHVEVLIFASDKPLTTLELMEMVNNALAFIEDRATPDQVDAALRAIREKYSAEFYPFEVRESGGGWQFLTKKDYHKTVALLNGDKFLKRLSGAALETLAIIAYKQPITKGEIEAIRGVSSDYSVQKLLEKELILITGRNEDMPGKPLVYTTSKGFMDYFGLNSAEELPRISEILSEQSVEPFVVTEAHPVETDGMEKQQLSTESDEEQPLTVDENGDLIIPQEEEVIVITEEAVTGYSKETEAATEEEEEANTEPETRKDTFEVAAKEEPGDQHEAASEDDNDSNEANDEDDEKENDEFGGSNEDHDNNNHPDERPRR